MNVLLHICCAPCAIYPLQKLRTQGFSVTGFFYNHNIHPYQEYRKRLETLQRYAQTTELEVIYRAEYELERFLGAVAKDPAGRCAYCYRYRLEAAAVAAKAGGYDSFSSTLLYSKFQQHDLIRQLGDEIAGIAGIPFYYEDFRQGWQEGIKASKDLALYRQQYCGCIYSERDRYAPLPKASGGK